MKEVKKWITVNGRHVPIYEEGSAPEPKKYEDKSKDVNLSEYEYVANQRGYQTYRKIVDGKGVWAAQDQDEKYPAFPITYDQALGYEPIITEHTSNAERLGYEVGKALFGPKDDEDDKRKRRRK